MKFLKCPAFVLRCRMTITRFYLPQNAVTCENVKAISSALILAYKKYKWQMCCLLQSMKCKIRMTLADTYDQYKVFTVVYDGPKSKKK